MSKRSVITVGGVALAAAVLLLVVRWVWSGQQPVNLLLITLDTTRADRLGCYGYKLALTPHLNELSARGVQFEQALCSVPITLPSHTTILSGLQPPEHGLHINGRKHLDPGIPTLGGVLWENGYHTAAFVASFALDSKFGLDSGFNSYDDDMSGAYKQKIKDECSLYRPGSLVTDAALAWLEAEAHEPFFCWVHLYDPHLPYHHHDALVGTRFQGQRSYDAEIAFMDMQVGRLMRFLKERKLLPRTLVIAVGDHGEGLEEHGEPDHGWMLYDSTLRVPLIVSGPGRIPQGERVHCRVSLVDLMPTVLDILGIPPSQEQEERSFKPALFGRQVVSRPHYAQTDQPYANYGWAPLRSLTTERWKYIRTPRPELYDRQGDPTELNNLASAQPDALAGLEAALAAIEAQMTIRGADQVELSPDEVRRLESLGYLAGQDFDAEAVDLSTLPDIKDRMAVVEMDRQMHRLLHEGKTAEAVALAQKSVRLAPESVPLRCYLGDALSQAGQLEQAAEVYRQVIDMQPYDESAHNNLGVVLAKMGEHEQAAQCYAEALRLKPDYPAAHSNLSAILIGAGRLDEAIDHLSQALRSHPQYADAHYNMGRARALQRDFDGAVSHYQTALRLEPDRLDALNALAWLLATQEAVHSPDAEQAVQLAQRACELTGYQEPAVLDTLAAAYAEAGQFAQAITNAEKALTLASSQGQEELADDIRNRLELYKRERPYRQPS